MTILINAISAKRGGIVTYTLNLMRSFSQSGIPFEVMMPLGFSDEAHVRTTRAGGYNPLLRLAWEQTVWRGIVSRRRPRVLFSSANFALFGSPVPQVLLVREGGLFDPFYLANVAPEQGGTAAVQRMLRRRLMLWSASATNLVITPTWTMRDLLLMWNPDLESKVQVNSYGTLTEAFTPNPQVRSWRGDGKLRLLYVSVYYPHKDPGTLARAAERLNERGLVVQARITMSVDEIRGVRGGLQDADILRRVNSKGFLELGGKPYRELISTYQQSDVFVFPSISETFGHPLVEAMSSGLPVVAADTLTNREICGDCALYFKPFSVTGLVDCIMRLDADPDLRRDMIERGRRRAVSCFSWQAHVDRLLEIFDQVGGPFRPRG